MLPWSEALNLEVFGISAKVKFEYRLNPAMIDCFESIVSSGKLSYLIFEREFTDEKFKEIYEYIKKLGFKEQPNYEFIIDRFK